MITKQEIHHNICNNVHLVYKAKNADYDDSFSKVRDLVPNAILVRLHDKMNRITKLLTTGVPAKVLDESISDTLLDLAGYAILELVEREYESQSEDVDLLENHLTLPMDRLRPAFANVAKDMLEEAMFGEDVKEVSAMTSEEVVEYYKQKEGK